MTKIKNIAVLTSGGDSPGMNAAIRAVVRAGIFNKKKVFGVINGYDGLINGNLKELKSRDVSNIIQNGGTILKTARSKEFRTKKGRQNAYDNLQKFDINALIVIGGDGTLRGAREFTAEFNIPVIGMPGTIDNDLWGTDYTIGYDTALNTVVEAVDKIRDTAASHNRLFFIEVMGRDAGFLALRSGIACGAEAILIPETDSHLDQLKDYLEKGKKKRKTSSIIMVAEGDEEGGAYEIAEKVKKDFSEYKIRVSILGHIQRGGRPSAFDRVLASRLGVAAVDALLDDQKSIMVGLHNTEVVHIPFNKTIKHHKAIKDSLIVVADILTI